MKIARLLFIFLFYSVLSFASDIPKNSHVNKYSITGWTCDFGFAKRENVCIHISQATDNEVKHMIILDSITNYPGNCPCPYFTDNAGRRCGGRSAYSRAGGYSPICYESDISDKEVLIFRQKFR